MRKSFHPRNKNEKLEKKKKREGGHLRNRVLEMKRFIAEMKLEQMSHKVQQNDKEGM